MWPPCTAHFSFIAFAAWLWTNLQISARRQRLLRLLSSAFLSNLTVFFALKPFAYQRTLRASERHPFNCLQPCGFLSRWLRNVRLTLMLTQAELLTEILGHHTWARAVARMVRVITWLVVVHLIGWVIWSKRRVLRLTQKVLSALEVIFRTIFWGKYTFFKLDFCPQPAKNIKNRCWV